MRPATVVSLAIAASLVLTVPAMAQSASQVGGNAYDTLVQLLQGNLGRLLGLVVVLAGLYQAIIKKEWGAGLVMVIGGTLFGLAPEIFDATSDIVRPIIESLSKNGL